MWTKWHLLWTLLCRLQYTLPVLLFIARWRFPRVIWHSIERRYWISRWSRTYSFCDISVKRSSISNLCVLIAYESLMTTSRTNKYKCWLINQTSSNLELQGHSLLNVCMLMALWLFVEVPMSPSVLIYVRFDHIATDFFPASRFFSSGLYVASCYMFSYIIHVLASEVFIQSIEHGFLTPMPKTS